MRLLCKKRSKERNVDGSVFEVGTFVLSGILYFASFSYSSDRKVNMKVEAVTE